MKPQFKLGNIVAGRGEKKKGTLGSVGLANGCQVEIPLIVLNGAADGPVLTVMSGIHGTELTGVASLLQAIGETDPQKMRGTFVGIVGANPFACRDGVYKNPYDASHDVGGNVFSLPEDPTMTQRMSYMVGRALEVADYVIDMHAAPQPSIDFTLMNSGICKDEWTRNETRKICEAFGVTVIDWPRPGQTSRDVCAQRGKPSITPELHDNIWLLETAVKVGAIGIRNVMKAIGMVEGELEKQPVEKLEGDFVAQGRLTVNRGGLLFVRKAPGVKISKGDVVAEVVSLYGDVVEQVRLPFTGYIWAYTGNLNGSHAVNEGDKIAYTFAERKDLE